MSALCRDCFAIFENSARCPICARPRIVAHEELCDLHIAHMDCDAFFASVEKRDNPELRNKPVIIGGGDRGVVSTACYMARLSGVRSAMPMFQARRLCPQAVVIAGRMERYKAVSRQIHHLMADLTPAIEPLSIDEAFLDLSGTAKLHGAPPAVVLAKLAKAIKSELGITGSIGLSHNKFLAKIASDLDKPNGFSVIGKKETLDFLGDKPVRIIWGIGPAGQSKLNREGIHTINDLRLWNKTDLTARFGTLGGRLWHLARGQDSRPLRQSRDTKSISNETTFAVDLSDLGQLQGHLWRMAEKCAARAKANQLAGRIVILKLKRDNHKSLTRRKTLHQATQLADIIYREGETLLRAAMDEAPFRLLGVGIGDLCPAAHAEGTTYDLLDPHKEKRATAERASDKIREKFGATAIIKGRSLR